METFIDDYNRKLWAFVLKSKDQVLSVFKDFQARAERESRRKLKVVQTDNGGEYRGQFEEYCKTRGMINLGREHWEAVKWILRYLGGTLSM